MKYKIAGFITEINIHYDKLKKLSEPFICDDNENAEIFIDIKESRIDNLLNKMIEGTTREDAEEFAASCDFNKAIISKNAMLLHSSAIMYNGGGYLFSAQSGVGKSTHTRLWKSAFGDKVKYINDDKPVVKIDEKGCIVYGTPFDGGSGIANNISAPLKAIIFIKRADKNSIRKMSQTSEILQELYFSTVHMVDKITAVDMLKNFERLIKLTDFYMLECNTDIESALVAKKALITE